MKTFLAVDFGTTQSSVAILTESSTREPQVVEINDGQRVVKAITTAMQLDVTGNIAYFGAKALSKSEDAPERTFQNFKVYLGENAGAYRALTGQDKYTPDKLALMFLTHLRKLIEEHYFNGAKLSSMTELSCIIGCPSDWDEVRKENLKGIAQSAGFPMIRLCDEPIGVIYYNHFFGGLKLSKSQNILVYDFGGGTTDVAIAKVNVSDSGKIEPSVLSVGGLPNLGGMNFDEAIVNHYLAENHYDLSTVPIKSQIHDRWVIGLAAREVKEDLSCKESIEKTINRLKVSGGEKPQKLVLSRAAFNATCAELIERFDEPVYDALTYAGLSAEDINFVILAGGSSAMPFVREKMSGIFSDKKIIMSPSTEVVAQGLAVFGRAEEVARTKQAAITASQMGQGNAAAGVDSVWEDEDDDDEDESFLKRHKKALIGAAAVLVIGAASVHGYIKYKEQEMIQEQARIKAAQKAAQKAEQERIRIAQEEAERKKAEAEKARRQAELERQAAQRAREEAERRAREASRRRYLGKSTIQSIIKSYGFERSYIIESLMLNSNSEILGIGSQAVSPYIVFTVDGVSWHRGYLNGKPVKVQGASYVDWSYEQLRNGVTDAQVRSELRHLPNAQKVINAVLEIKNY